MHPGNSAGVLTQNPLKVEYPVVHLEQNGFPFWYEAEMQFANYPTGGLGIETQLE